ncbi:MAG TPA: KH domain-containing protein [Terriglobales bacterium]|nr:KH domain-containing protein [Terriglobales bacterium]
MTEQAPNTRALIEHIAKALVEDKNAVFIDEYEDGDETVIELEVAEAEVGKIIGRSGRIARALRTILAAAATKNDTRYALEILE